MIDPRTLPDRVERLQALDAAEGPWRAVAKFISARPALKDALHGTWLGHPLHPMLTDLPIGFFTVSWFCDLVPLKRLRRFSDAMIAMGLVSAVPTALAGVADWSDLDPPARRTGTLHGILQAIAHLYYLRSLLARLRGRRARGVRLAMTGAAVMTLSAYLGGHLIARRGAGVDRNALGDEAFADWTPLVDESSLAAGTPVVASGVLLVRDADGVHAIADRCVHAGGPLHEGEFADGCVRCPWHGSVFRVADGSVVHGPAAMPQPRYETRVVDGKVEVRRQ